MMALELHIPPCRCQPPNAVHPPSIDKPVRIQIEGPLESIEKLIPGISWPVESFNPFFPLPAGPELAKAAFRAIYGVQPRQDVDRDLIVRDEYLGWVMLGRGQPIKYFIQFFFSS